MSVLRSILFGTLACLCAVATAQEGLSAETQALLRPMPERAVMMGNILLTLEEDVQMTAQQAMEEQVEAAGAARGYAVLLHADTGELAAVVSAGNCPEGANIVCVPDLPVDGVCELPVQAAAREPGISLPASREARVRLYEDVISRFGLDAPVGIGIQDDCACETVTPDNNKAELSLADVLPRISAMHLADCYAVVLNKGERTEPRLIKGLMLKDGERYLPTKPAAVRRVLSEQTAAAVCPAGDAADRPYGCSRFFCAAGGDAAAGCRVNAGFFTCAERSLVLVTVLEEASVPQPADAAFRALAERLIPLYSTSTAANDNH